MRILLVEDDTRTAAFIIKGLRQQGFSIDHAIEGEMGLRLAKSENRNSRIRRIRQVR